MTDPTPSAGTADAAIARSATGAACAIFDRDGRVLLVRHTYGKYNWELPGGLGEAGEAPHETATREVLEETGLVVELAWLTGVYYESTHRLGAMLHFVFRGGWSGGVRPKPSSPEIGDLGWWPLDALPTPISDFTERRISDAAGEGRQPVVARVEARRWRE